MNADDKETFDETFLAFKISNRYHSWRRRLETFRATTARPTYLALERLFTRWPTAIRLFVSLTSILPRLCS